MSDIRTVTLEELLEKKRRGEIAPTPPDAPEYDLPDEFWERAEVVYPERKTPVSLRVEPEVLAWFKAQGPGHLTRMQAVLRAYVEAKRKQEEAGRDPG